VNPQVTPGRSLAGQPPTCLHLLFGERPSVNAPGWYLTFEDLHPTLSTRAMTTTGGINRDRIPTGNVEDVHSDRGTHLLTRRLEDDGDARQLLVTWILQRGHLGTGIFDEDSGIELIYGLIYELLSITVLVGHGLMVS